MRNDIETQFLFLVFINHILQSRYESGNTGRVDVLIEKFIDHTHVAGPVTDDSADVEEAEKDSHIDSGTLSGRETFIRSRQEFDSK
jgi:hypothetical protein